MKKSILRVTSILILAALLLNPDLSFTGAKSGLLLWFNVVLPTLLPFMVCSNVIVALGAVPLLVAPFSMILKKWFCLSEAGSYIWITGLLCGYPIGAKTDADFLREKRIGQKEGNYLLAIANHPSPMFLAGYVYSKLAGVITLPVLLLSIYLPVIPIAFLARRFYHVKEAKAYDFTPGEKALSFDELLMSSLEVMVKIGGYIMLFSIFVVFFNTYLPDTFTAKAACLGIIEITTGIQEIAARMSGLPAAAVIVAVTAFGGLSGIAQTKTVIKNAGLSIRHYIAWKWLHLILSGAVFILLQVFLLPLIR